MKNRNEVFSRNISISTARGIYNRALISRTKQLIETEQSTINIRCVFVDEIQFTHINLSTDE